MSEVSFSADHQLRHRLGIPEDAERVLIFSESSHWDPNWLLTADEYFNRFVRDNLDQAIAELQQEPRRIYSIECIFFLQMYWDQCLAQRDNIRRLVNEGRLRLTSTGVTTADTLLPSAEAILRDLLIGQEWLRSNGMLQEPNLAYFTDSFGCSPALPSLLKAAGFDRTTITRIDGMFFMGCDLESPKRFPRAGSSAEQLLKQERTLDFVWQDMNGAQVLCHWNAFTYGQGDMLAYAGASRVYLARISVSLRSDRHVARRIKQYVAQLSPYSRTPYMFCPIGFDFVEPIPGLVSLLDRYNQNHYPTTGVWAVNAGLDDYLDLIEEYKDDLPILELDPNPYWTGFYTTRPALKKQCRELVDDLLLAEQLSCLPENHGAEQTISKELETAWWSAVVSNHHDFITGTSPDRIVEEEQSPWLEQAAASVNEVIDRLASSLLVQSGEVERSDLPDWIRRGSQLQIKTAHYVVELDEAVGGAVVSMRASDGETYLLKNTSNDLVSYQDSGGLWRMGLEFWGGIWKKSEQARRKDSPVIRCRVEGLAAEGYSVTVRFATSLEASKLTMDTPGGVVTRPLQRIYDPTFWPVEHFMHFQSDDTGRGLAIIQSMPGAISCQPDGQLELVAMRNATREKIFGLVGIPGNPASGYERENYAFEYALLFTDNGDWRENNIHLMARDVANYSWCNPRDSVLYDIADSIVTTNSPDIWVTTVKPAARGEGIIVRLYTLALTESQVVLKTSHFKVIKAFLCDARERDLELLDVQDGVVHLMMPGVFATIRLIQD
jgi:hypothetical protein